MLGTRQCGFDSLRRYQFPRAAVAQLAARVRLRAVLMRVRVSPGAPNGGSRSPTGRRRQFQKLHSAGFESRREHHEVEEREQRV